jgi:hypothetical protein
MLGADVLLSGPWSQPESVAKSKDTFGLLACSEYQANCDDFDVTTPAG